MPVIRRFLSSILKKNSSEYISNMFPANKFVLRGKEEITYKGGNEQQHYLNSVFKKIPNIGIIGWGPQARAQACNLQDTFNIQDIKTKITIGLRENSASISKASKLGFDVKSIEEVTKQSDLLLFLVSDSAQVSLYKSVFANMKNNATLGFSHGFLLGHLKNNNEYFPDNINVIGMCPKGMGDSVRDLYLNKCGNSINSSICIEKVVPNSESRFSQYITDYSNPIRPIDLALGWAIGIGSPYIFTTSLQSEWVSDLVGERGILLGGLFGIMQSMELLSKKYLISTEQAYNYTSKLITGPLSEHISKKGILSVYNDMITKSNLKDYFRVGYCLSYKNSKNLMEEIYNEVNSGNEIRSVITSEKNKSIIKTSLSGHSSFWNNKSDKENINQYNESYIINHPLEAFCAGSYLGAMMAQIDVLIDNNHSYSEIVNESIIEAVDSLNPYMYKKGIDWMVDNCSITARIGTRKWGPRFHTLYTNYLVHNDQHNVPHEEHTLFRDFLKHPIHNMYEFIRKIK